MSAAGAIPLVGGLGLFLLGIHHLTEGLKGLAGDSLRRALQRMVAGRLSAVVSGAVITVVLQSSTATTLTVIGFVSAGLVSFAQAVGVIVGATFGTTSTPWLVAIFGFRVSVAAAALPMLGLGAFLWMIAKGRTRSLGAILAGFGLLFFGIEFLQTGMQDITWNLDAIAGTGPGARWVLGGIGMLMSIVMQSSSAAAAATLVALHAGSLNFEQGCALIVGQAVGTAATSALVAIGAGLAVRRAALAHIVYSVGIGILGLLLLRPLAAAADWIGTQLDDPDGVLALAAFSSIFKLVGVAAFFPWLDRFSQLIVQISGKGAEGAVARLDSAVAAAGGPIALEAAWRATLELARGSLEAVRRRLAGNPVAYDPPIEAIRQTEAFVQSLSLETIDLGAFEPRLVRLVHAIDHLARLDEVLQRPPPAAAGWQPPLGFAAGAQALGDWLDATRDPEAASDADQNAALEAAATQLADEARAGRAAMLEDVAMQRLPTATARAALDLSGWADSALHHAWRLAASLREAAGDQPAAALIRERG